jgi:hypothetical protein
MTPAQIRLNAAIARASFMTNGHRGRDWRSGRLFVAAGKGDEFDALEQCLEAMQDIRLEIERS